MGVPGYFRTLIKGDSELLTSSIENNEYLFFDYNNLIYLSFQKYLHSNDCSNKNLSAIENEIIKAIIKETLYYIKLIKPSKLIYLAMDGTPPRAKMEQQRARRYKSIPENILLNKLKKKYNKDDTIYFDSIKISPGTVFMDKLSKELQKSIKSGYFGKNIEIILSDTSVIGEGEQKIIPYIKEKIKDKANICIFGDDADLIFLSLQLIDKNHKIFIIKTNNNIPNKYKNIGYCFLDIVKVGENFYNYIDLKQFNIKNLLFDYIFLMMLFGDDFVKNIPGLDIKIHLGYLEQLYKQNLLIFNKHLVNIKENGKFEYNNEFIKNILTDLSKNEKNFLFKKQNNMMNTCSKPYNNRDGLDGYELEKEIMEHSFVCQKENPFYEEYHKELGMIDYSKDKHIFKKQYYNYFFDIKDYNKDRSDICKAYIKSWKFAFEYYILGIPSWRDYYPYRVAPFASDILTNLNYKNNNLNINNVKFKENKPYSPYQQLMLIIPPQKKNLLPKCYGDILSDKKFEKFFPKDFKIDFANGLKYWRSEPILSHVNEKEIFKEMEKCKDKLNKTNIEREKFREELIFKL
jgi:5'-3' exonuclease